MVYTFQDSLLPPVARFLDVSSDDGGQFAFAVPLPGDDNTRTLVAAALVRTGRADRLAVVQGDTSPRIADLLVPSSAEVTRRVAIARGISPQRIVMLKGASTGTLTDLQLIGKLWETDPAARIAVVSNGFHLRRARWSARRELGERADLIRYIAAPFDHCHADNWWQTEAGFSWVTSEYFKLGYYIARYGSWRDRAMLMVPLVGVAALMVGRWKFRGARGRG